MRTTPRRNLIIVILLAALCGLSAFPKEGTAAPLYSNPGTTNLIAWWSLDETSGTRNDSHGSYHLTDNNTVGYTTGKIGNAANFIAANSEYLSISDTDNALGGDGTNKKITYGGWVYLEQNQSILIISKRNVSGNYEYWMNYLQSNYFRCFISGNGTNVVEVEATNFGVPSPGNWYFVLCGNNGSHLWISVNAGTRNTATFSSNIYDGTLPIRMGGAPSISYMNGNIDEYFFFQVALSDDQISWLYNSGNGRKYCEVADTCATPTPAASNTPTNTITFTPSNTPTITFTPSNTPTITFTPSNTPTFTNTVPGVTDTHTPTITFTPSDTPTITFTPSITSTPTITFTPSITPTPGEFATAFWDGQITYGDAANVTVLSLLCLIMAVGLMAWFVTTYLQRKRK